jgi:hypothetical protein
MKPDDAHRALSSMRCEGCGRAPTRSEVLEMVDDFGHRLQPEHVPELHWNCKACDDRNRRRRANGG